MNQQTKTPRKCNCISKNTCHLNENCLLENILFVATITCDKNPEKPRNYKGICVNRFKKRYADHKRSFNTNRYKNETKISVDHWNLIAGNCNAKVTWAVKHKFSEYNPQVNRCSLGLNEKIEILEGKGSSLLNKNSEVTSNCRHRNM